MRVLEEWHSPPELRDAQLQTGVNIVTPPIDWGGCALPPYGCMTRERDLSSLISGRLYELVLPYLQLTWPYIPFYGVFAAHHKQLATGNPQIHQPWDPQSHHNSWVPQ